MRKFAPFYPFVHSEMSGLEPWWCDLLLRRRSKPWNQPFTLFGSWLVCQSQHLLDKAFWRRQATLFLWYRLKGRMRRINFYLDIVAPKHGSKYRQAWRLVAVFRQLGTPPSPWESSSLIDGCSCNSGAPACMNLGQILVCLVCYTW
jgi:hypothetical protein